MVAPAYKPLSASRSLGTSARILRHSQAFRRPFNKQLGYISAAIFTVLFLASALLHGYSFGAPDEYALDSIRAAANYWHFAFIGDGPGAARADVVYNPVQFLLFFISSMVHLPPRVLLILQALAAPALLGYLFARMLADRAKSWVIGLAAVVGGCIFINADFTLAVASGSPFVWLAVSFTALCILMALDIKTKVVNPALVWVALLVALSHSLALFVLVPTLVFYYKRMPKVGQEKKLRLVWIYSLSAALVWLLIRLVYFGTLGFFDPIINFQWQVSVHGFSAFIGGITQALYQMEDAGGLAGLVLLVLALFVERQHSLGFLGLTLLTASIMQGLQAIFIPTQAGYVSTFVWLTPLYFMVPAFFIMNPLPQFLQSWNTRLFIASLMTVMIASMTWPTKAKQYDYYPELAGAVDKAVASLGIEHPIVYGDLPDPTAYNQTTWASRERISPALRQSPGVLAEWFFEIAAPDIVIRQFRFGVDSLLLSDARFEKNYALHGMAGRHSAVYVRRDIAERGEEFQLYQRLLTATLSESASTTVPQVVTQELRRLEQMGGTYHLLPLVRSLQRLVPQLDWTSTLHEVGDIMAQTEGGFLNKILVTASYSGRFTVELVDEITRYYFISNFTASNLEQRQKLTTVLDPVACLPNAPGFQDGRIKVYLNRNSLMVYLPNAHEVDTLAPFFIKMNRQLPEGTMKLVRAVSDLNITDNLVLLSSRDGYASFMIPGNIEVSSLEIGQRSADNRIMWSTNFSLDRLRNRDNF